MFNLLRMDLYRVRKSKSVYICLGILFISTVLVFSLLWLMAVPQGQKTAVRIGMLRTEEPERMLHMLDGVDSLAFFRQICLDGGMYNVIFGIWFMLFVCMDFQSGFIKNIMALHQNRWNYVGSKLAAAGIVNFCYLVLHLLFTLLMNRLFGNMVPYTEWKSILFYMTWIWLLTTAFAALVLLVCVVSRSVAAGALAAVFFGGGVVVMALYSILNLFHIGGWLKYTIYLTGSMGPGQFSHAGDLYAYAVGAGFLVLYTAAAGVILKKQDI